MYYDVVESGKRIKELRIKKGLSQNDLAEAIGIHNKSVSKAERGVNGLSVDNLIQLAEYFGVSLDYLILGHNDDLSVYKKIALLPEEKRLRIEKIINDILEFL